MNRPRNTYTPGQPVRSELHAIGRPVSLFTTADTIEPGIVTSVDVINGVTLYDIRVIEGGKYRNLSIGTLMNPQPNTFVFAP